MTSPQCIHLSSFDQAALDQGSISIYLILQYKKWVHIHTYFQIKEKVKLTSSHPDITFSKKLQRNPLLKCCNLKFFGFTTNTEKIRCAIPQVHNLFFDIQIKRII